MQIILLTEFQRELWLNNWLSLTKVRLPISEWAVPKLFIHLWVDKMALLSMMSKFHFEHYDFVVVRLCKLYCSLRLKERCDLTIIGFHWQKSGCPSLSGLCQSFLSIIEWTKWHFCQWCPNFIWNVWFWWGWVMQIILLTEFPREVWLHNNWLSLTKVRLPILEWAVPKLFIHLWVDKMALLSMMSKFHFEHYDFVVVRLCKLYCSLSFKESCDLTIIVFHWHNSGCPSLSGLCQSFLSIFEWTKWHFCQWCPNFIWNVWFRWSWVMQIILLTEFQRELWLNNNWLSLTKVRLPISEWAVPKLFIHLWVDKMALLSMMSKFHFAHMISLRLGYANYIANWVSKRGLT